MSVAKRTYRLPVSGVTITYELERKQVKNINMRVRRDGSIHISIPSGISSGQVEAFLREREDWLLGAMERVTQRTKSHPDLPELALGDSLPYLGGRIRLVFRTLSGTASSGRQGRFDFDREAGVLTCSLPDPSDAGWRQAGIETFERVETRRLVMQFLDRHFPAFARRGIPFPKSIRFKRMTSRHGSCTAQNGSLNFNIRLCEYPLPFIEYVVVHELCHFLHQDHSPAFYREVAAILPDYREREKLGEQ